MAAARDRHREQRGVLDDLLGGAEHDSATPALAGPAPAAASRQKEMPPPGATARLSARLPAEIVERSRDAAFHSPGLTLTSLLTRALTREIDRLEAERGEEFPRRTGRIRTGRPLG
jgi:hypothetical protein